MKDYQRDTESRRYKSVAGNVVNVTHIDFFDLQSGSMVLFRDARKNIYMAAIKHKVNT